MKKKYWKKTERKKVCKCRGRRKIRKKERDKKKQSIKLRKKKKKEENEGKVKEWVEEQTRENDNNKRNGKIIGTERKQELRKTCKDTNQTNWDTFV